MTEIMEQLQYYSRFILPVMAVIILGSCIYSLLKLKIKPYSMAELVNTINGDKIPLDRWEISVGRSKLCDITIGYGSVSRFHAVISRRSDGWFITDTFSKTGTKVNDKEVKKPVQLFDGDSITFGSAVMVFSAPLYPSPNPRIFAAVKPASQDIPLQAAEAPVEEIPEEIPMPDISSSESKEENPAIYVVRSAHAFPLKHHTYIIGREEECDIVLPSQLVSRHHAKITAEDDGFAIEDLGSKAGTIINGKQISRKQLLFNGDEINLGGEELIFYDNYSRFDNYKPF